MTAADVDSSFLTFAEETLGFSLYDWQADAIEPFDGASEALVQVSLATPNGSGKSAIVIPTLALGWLALYPKGRVVCTTADGKQLDGQVMPAIEAHRAKWPQWKFIEREITTPTGGRFVAFTTDQAGRAEGWHKLDDRQGPLLIIADEAKTIPEDIFSAIDRCTYNAILLASSPGRMAGRFYESQMRAELGFHRVRVGLKDCPHIPKEKIDRIEAQHGPDSPFTRSTLHGEFMEADGEARFDRAGLDRLMEMAKAHEALPFNHADKPIRGTVEDQDQLGRKTKLATWFDDQQGWVWMAEKPTPGFQYIAWCDPMTGEQSEGSKVRDTHAAGIMRLAYADTNGGQSEDEIVAVLHHDDGCRWDNDILAERFDRLIRYFGDCMVIVEANNAGVEVMRLLLQAGRILWKREKRDHVHPGKKLEVVGFQTNSATKNLWIGALGRAIREQEIVCKYRAACEQFGTFILNEKGTGEAQAGCKDDFVTGVGLGLYARASASRFAPKVMPVMLNQYGSAVVFGQPAHNGRSPHGGGAS